MKSDSYERFVKSDCAEALLYRLRGKAPDIHILSQNATGVEPTPVSRIDTGTNHEVWRSISLVVVMLTSY
jgi:hypothetical protein